MSDQENENIKEKVIPYNKKNRLITKRDIEVILKKNGINKSINNIDVYKTAFVHKSYVKNNIIKTAADRIDFEKKHQKKQKESDIEYIYYTKEELEEKNLIDLQTESYERLEFYGDTEIQRIITGYIWRRFESENEGFMTRLRSKLVRTTMLSQFSRFLELYNYVLITDHCEKENFRSNPKILEDIFEAFIGAISLDIGYKAAETLVINIIQKRVNFTELIYTDDNYKDKLMRYYQKYYDGYTPKYIVIKTEGELPDVIYTMGVLDIDGNIVGEGTDTSKKQASQIAAKEALKKYNEN